MHSIAASLIAFTAAADLLWFACLIAATSSLGRWLQRSAVIMWRDRLTGGVFMGFGIGVALESRRP